MYLFSILGPSSIKNIRSVNYGMFEASGLVLRPRGGMRRNDESGAASWIWSLILGVSMPPDESKWILEVDPERA